jgi:glucose-1-phosphate cytidylyltransferase
MKSYSAFGLNEFIICCGYRGYVIKEYFANYFLHMSDVTFSMKEGSMEVHKKTAEPWTVTLIDTGDDTLTGGRIRRVEKYLRDDDAFCLTYGDGVSDVDISSLVDFHKASGKLATVTTVYPPGRFGALDIEDGMVSSFTEKPKGDGGMINGGFFVLSPAVIDLIEGDDTAWEGGPLEQLAEDRQLNAFEHRGFWQPMDTLRDKNLLEQLWNEDRAPWKVW